MVRHKNASDSHLQMLIAMSIDRDCQRERGSFLLPMDNQCGWIALLSINKHDDHLAIAIIGSMVRTGTLGMSQTGYMQVERLYDTETDMG
jgi:hypothetical protein